MKTTMLPRTMMALSVGLTMAGCETSERVAYRTGETGARVAHGTAHVGTKVVRGTGRSVAYVGRGIEHVGERIAD